MKTKILKLIDTKKEKIQYPFMSDGEEGYAYALQELRQEIEAMEDEHERIVNIIRRFGENNDGNHQGIYDTALEIIDLI